MDPATPGPTGVARLGKPTAGYTLQVSEDPESCTHPTRKTLSSASRRPASSRAVPGKVT